MNLKQRWARVLLALGKEDTYGDRTLALRGGYEIKLHRRNTGQHWPSIGIELGRVSYPFRLPDDSVYEAFFAALVWELVELEAAAEKSSTVRQAERAVEAAERELAEKRRVLEVLKKVTG